MNARLGIVGAALSIGVLMSVGCRAPSEEEIPSDGAEPADTDPAELVAATTYLCKDDTIRAFKSWSDTSCTGASVTLTNATLLNAKKISQSYFEYIFGGPTPPLAYTTVPSTGASMDRSKHLRTMLCGMRAAIASGDVAVARDGNAQLCQFPSSEYKLTGFVNWAAVASKCPATAGYYTWTYPEPVGKVMMNAEWEARALNGWCQHTSDAPTFFRTANTITNTGTPEDQAIAFIDPDVWQLGASPLQSYNFASAPAKNRNTGVWKTAFKVPNYYVTCPTNVYGGSPCSTSAVAAYGNIYGAVSRSDGRCRCVL